MNPKIKIKERKNTFNMKVKVSKEDVESLLTSTEALVEFKKNFMNQIDNELNEFIIEKVKSENDESVVEEVSTMLKGN